MTEVLTTSKKLNSSNLVDQSWVEQFDKLCKLIESELGIPVRVGNQTVDKPLKEGTEEIDYPFYNFNVVNANPVSTGGESEEYDAENDILIRKTAETWEFTLLFTCLSKNMYQSMEGATALNNWFGGTPGRYAIKALGQAYVKKTMVTPRDAFLVVNIERRYGFEVVIRMGRVITKEVSFIETASAKGTIHKY